MPDHIPTKEDFPPDITLTIVPPPSPPTAPLEPPIHPPASILVLLHGLGDSQVSISQLGVAMRLPETMCISIRAPTSLPFSEHEGYHWGDDIVVDTDSSVGGVDVQACGYKKAVDLVLEKVIKGVLVDKCGYNCREIVIMGFGQGGTVGLGVAEALARESEGEASSGGDSTGGKELGGVISLGGPVSEEVRVRSMKVAAGDKQRKSRTPVLVCHGRGPQSVITEARQREIKDTFEFVEMVKWDRPHDGMAENREQMMPIMKFFGRRLRSREGVPEGAVEIG